MVKLEGKCWWYIFKAPLTLNIKYMMPLSIFWLEFYLYSGPPGRIYWGLISFKCKYFKKDNTHQFFYGIYSTTIFPHNLSLGHFPPTQQRALPYHRTHYLHVGHPGDVLMQFVFHLNCMELIRAKVV